MKKSSTTYTTVTESTLRSWLEAQAREQLDAGLPWLVEKVQEEAKLREQEWQDLTFFKAAALEGAACCLPLMGEEAKLALQAQAAVSRKQWYPACEALAELREQGVVVAASELAPSMELAKALAAAAAGRLEPLAACEALVEAAGEESEELEAVAAFFSYGEPVVRGASGELRSRCDVEEEEAEAPEAPEAGPLFAEDPVF